MAAIEQWGAFGPAGVIVDSVASAYLKTNKYDRNAALQMINTQFWIATFLNEYEAWANYRRTGFPVLNPTTYPISQSPGAVPRRMQYSTVDKQVNPDNYNIAVKGLTGGDKITSRMWWDTN